MAPNWPRNSRRSSIIEAVVPRIEWAQQRAGAKAKTVYQDVLALSKDADPDIPILKKAQAEYARLQ